MKVFLSYAESDRDVAKKIASRLEGEGHNVWSEDNVIFPGENVAREIGKALDKAEAMVVLISPDAMKSKSVRHEIEFALGASQYRGRLIPVVVKPTAEIPWILKKLPNVRLGKRMAETSREIGNYIKHGFEVAPSKT